MKKSLLFLVAAATCGALSAQTYNYFDPRDCDENGWLWFDTQTKLEKYCGYTSDYKIILSGAQFENADGEYAECVLDATIFGYNKNGEQFQPKPDGDENAPDVRAEGTWTGAIIAPRAKTYGAQNGGGIIMHLPDLAEFSVAMSSEGSLSSVLLAGSKEAGEIERIDLAIVKGFAPPFLKLTSDCQYTWGNLQNQVNANTGLTLASPEGTPVTAAVFGDTTSDVLFQGIKVFTYTQTEYPEYDDSSVAEIGTVENAPVEFYNMQGVRVSGDEPGFYIRRQGSKTTKILVK